jgi:hypothetical protein
MPHHSAFGDSEFILSALMMGRLKAFDDPADAMQKQLFSGGGREMKKNKQNWAKKQTC